MDMAERVAELLEKNQALLVAYGAIVEELLEDRRHTNDVLRDLRAELDALSHRIEAVTRAVNSRAGVQA